MRRACLLAAVVAAASLAGASAAVAGEGPRCEAPPAMSPLPQTQLVALLGAADAPAPRCLPGLAGADCHIDDPAGAPGPTRPWSPRAADASLPPAPLAAAPPAARRATWLEPARVRCAGFARRLDRPPRR